MGSPSNDETFEETLSQDLAWRRIELHTLRGLLESSKSRSLHSPETRTLVRAMVTLLYAHWEGFCKSSLESYTQLVVRRRPNISITNDAFTTGHMVQLLRRLDSGDVAARSELLDLARQGATPRLKINRPMLTNTKSNLRYKTLVEIFDNLGISASEFETRQRMIDILLCDRRNAIAHGRESFPDASDVLELHLEVLSMMEILLDLTVNQMRSKAYLRQA